MSIRNFQIKDTQLTNCICVVEPAPKKDERGAVRSDRVSGEPLYVVEVLATDEGAGEAEVLRIQVGGKPEGLRVGTPVKVYDLVISPWSVNGSSGVTFKASAITPAPISGTPASASALGPPGRAARAAASGSGEAS
jgi:hypothetical protein